MVGLIVGAAAGIGSALLQQRAQRKALERQQEGLARQYDLAQEMLEKTKPERQTLTQADLIRKQRAMEDPLADEQRKRADRDAASNRYAAMMAGPRGAAMLGQQQRAAADVQAKIDADSQRRTDTTLSQIAGREQQIEQFNALQDQKFLKAQADLKMGKLEAEENIAGQLAGLKGAGLAAALGGLSGVGYSMEGTQAGRRMDEQVGGLFGGRNQSTGTGASATGAATQTSALQGLNIPSLNYDFNYQPFSTSGLPQPIYGERGMRLPGEFSHATNPISLMHNGRKIGEATGNEVVLTPEQINKISKQSSYLRKLLKQPRFQ